MNDNFKLSIIVPVYNGENYIVNCLESLLNQTYKPIEVICVNDASTDGSYELLSSIATVNDNLIVINLTNNLKQGGARNRGVKASTGDYIAFVDVDDFVSKDMYLELMREANRTVCDVVDSDYFVKDGNNTYIVEQDDNIMVEKKHMINNFGRLWTKVFKRSVFFERKPLLFPEGIFYEDNYIQPFLALRTSSYIKLNKAFYYYRADNISTTRSDNNYKIFDRITSAKLMYEDYINSESNGRFNDELEYRLLRLGVYNTFLQVARSFSHYPAVPMNDAINLFDYVEGSSNPYFSTKEKAVLIGIRFFPKLLFHLVKVKDRLNGCCKR